MVAIVVFLSVVRAAPIAASMAVKKTGGDRTAPDKAEMKWRAARRRFVSGRGGGVAFGVRNPRMAVVVGRSRHSRFPVRHASSRRGGSAQNMGKGHDNGDSDINSP